MWNARFDYYYIYICVCVYVYILKNQLLNFVQFYWGKGIENCRLITKEIDLCMKNCNIINNKCV